MAKFYDEIAYESTHTLTGDEVFVIYQDQLTKTATVDLIGTELVSPLVDVMTLGGLLDVVLGTNIPDDSTLIYSSGTWRNDIRTYIINDFQDATVSSPQEGQMLMWDGIEWGNSNTPILKGYTEAEHNIGLVSDTCNIDLSNGNIQRLQVNGVLEIVLPTLPPVGQYWNLTLKIISDGVNTPTFTSSDGTLKWSDNNIPTDLGVANKLNVYMFVSDTTSLKVYGLFVGDIVEE